MRTRRVRKEAIEPHGHRDRRRLQRGAGDRAAAREPARARLPGRQARDRRHLRRLDRPHATSSSSASATGVRLIVNPRGGKVAAQNRAVRETDGEIVAFSDANATWAPDALRQLVAQLRRPRRRLRLRAARARGGRRLEPGGRSTGATSWRSARPSRGSARSPAATARSTPCAAPTTSRSTRASGHDLSFPYLMVQRGRRAVYEPLAQAFEKPTPTNETEYRRKVRMFEHCWVIVLRGSMLKRLAVRLPASRSSRTGCSATAAGSSTSSCSRRRSRSSAKGSSTRSCSARSSLLLVAAAARRRDRALLRARHVGDASSRSGTTSAAACPRRGRRRRGRAEPRARRRDRRRRARAREPAARGRARSRSSSSDGGPGPLQADARRQGRRATSSC